MYSIDEDGSEKIEEATDSEEGLQAWCLLEESEIEPWQEVINRRDNQKLKRANRASLLSVENSHNSSSKKISEVKDIWVKVRVTMDYGVAAHLMLGGMFPRVKLERKTSPKRFVAANDVQIRDVGDKRGDSKMHNIQTCECCQTSHFNAESCPSRKHWCAE